MGARPLSTTTLATTTTTPTPPTELTPTLPTLDIPTPLTLDTTILASDRPRLRLSRLSTPLATPSPPMPVSMLPTELLPLHSALCTALTLVCASTTWASRCPAK